MRTPDTDISVVICSYTFNRWDGLIAAVESTLEQTIQPKEVIVVIDHNPELLERARAALPRATVIQNENLPGISGARNAGLSAATGEILAYLDDDAIASKTWLQDILAGYTSQRVLGAMGFIAPLWETERPGWFPEEFDWVIGCTYLGMPAGGEVRNLFGADSFVREILAEAGGFSIELGRTSTQALGGEETGACIRISQLYPAGVFIYTGDGRVDHHVPASRATWGYFRQRCWGEGISKANLAHLVGTRAGLSSERHYTLVTLPSGVGRALSSFVRGDRAGLARAAALLSGLAVTGTGYVVGSLRLRAQTMAERMGGGSGGDAN